MEWGGRGGGWSGEGEGWGGGVGRERGGGGGVGRERGGGWSGGSGGGGGGEGEGWSEMTVLYNTLYMYVFGANGEEARNENGVYMYIGGLPGLYGHSWSYRILWQTCAAA